MTTGRTKTDSTYDPIHSLGKKLTDRDKVPTGAAANAHVRRQSEITVAGTGGAVCLPTELSRRQYAEEAKEYPVTVTTKNPVFTATVGETFDIRGAVELKYDKDEPGIMVPFIRRYTGMIPDTPFNLGETHAMLVCDKILAGTDTASVNEHVNRPKGAEKELVEMMTEVAPSEGP